MCKCFFYTHLVLIATLGFAISRPTPWWEKRGFALWEARPHSPMTGPRLCHAWAAFLDAFTSVCPAVESMAVALPFK